MELTSGFDIPTPQWLLAGKLLGDEPHITTLLLHLPRHPLWTSPQKMTLVWMTNATEASVYRFGLGLLFLQKRETT